MLERSEKKTAFSFINDYSFEVYQKHRINNGCCTLADAMSKSLWFTLMQAFRGIRNQSDTVLRHQKKRQILLERTRKLCLLVGWVMDASQRKRSFEAISAYAKKIKSVEHGALKLHFVWMRYESKDLLSSLHFELIKSKNLETSANMLHKIFSKK